MAAVEPVKDAAGSNEVSLGLSALRITTIYYKISFGTKRKQKNSSTPWISVSIHVVVTPLHAKLSRLESSPLDKCS